MHLLLDTGLLGQLCHPGKAANKPASDWVEAILKSGSEERVFLPEVCDYELRGPTHSCAFAVRSTISRSTGKTHSWSKIRKVAVGTVATRRHGTVAKRSATANSFLVD